MTVKAVLTWPHKGLREKAEEVTEFDSDELKELVDDLKDTMKAYNAQGLAATQIGIPKRLVAVKDSSGACTVLINPEITASEGELTAAEGCLSFPGVFSRISRKAKLSVKAVSVFGDELVLELEGLEAVAIQHELDHLDGKVMLDYMKPTEKRFALKRLKKVKKRLGAYGI